MNNLTTNPKFKVMAYGKRVIVSNDDALLFICSDCGNLLNVFLHETPADREITDPAVPLSTGTTQYPAFNYCRCGQAGAPNPGGELRNIRQAVEQCGSVGEVLRMLDLWISFEEKK